MKHEDNSIKHPSLGEGLGGLEIPERDLDKWYAHLTVETKEQAMGEPYPHCTNLWNSISWSEKQYIYDAMGGREAHDHHKWKKNNSSLT